MHFFIEKENGNHMTRFKYFILIAVIAIVFWWLGKTPANAGFHQKEANAQTIAIVAAANDFLNTLSADQRKLAQMEFLRPKVATATQFDMSKMGPGPGGPPPGGHPPNGDSSRGNSQRPGNGQPNSRPASGEQYGKAVWSNFPINIQPRPGIELGGLNVKQSAAAMHLLQLLLSSKGYEKVIEIMGSDQALADAGTDVTAGAAHYLIGIFGTPDDNKPWMVEFGGHHLGLNIVVAGIQGALTPTLTGAQPAVYQIKGKTVRVLSAENDMAFDLLNTLDEQQRKNAILNYKVGDLVLGPGHDGETIVPEGLKASSMTARQKDMLINLISEWAGIINDAYVGARMKEIRDGIDSSYFAWSGPTTHEPGKNGSSYYRIQGPHVIIEFSPQGTFGDATVHVHTIYRDPLNNYGTAFTAP